MKTRFTFSIKVIIVVLIGILVPLITTLLLSTHNYSGMVSNTINSISIQQVDFYTNLLSRTFESAQKNINMWMTNYNIASFVTSQGMEEEDSQNIHTGLIELVGIDNFYRNAYLYVPAKETLYSAFQESGVVDYESMLKTDILRSIELSWQLYAGVYSYGKTSSSLACAVPIRERTTGKFQGYCMVKLSSLYLSNTFSQSTYPFGELYCVNANGGMAFTTDKTFSELPFSFDQSIATMTMLEIEGYNVYCRPIENSDLYLLSVSPTRIWDFGTTQPFTIGIIVSVFIVMFSVGITVLIIRYLLVPIHSLADAMKMNDPNELKLVELEGRTDEIGILRQTYNEMINRINKMIETQYRSDLILKDTQLKALQLQINPHYVNNTLNMISEMALEHDMFEICDALNAFSQMFYYSLRFKSDVVSFGDELNYLKHYTYLQERRFPGKFILNLDIDERTKPMGIPKMTLQPIIENVFRHSFFGVSRKVNVTIFTALCSSGYQVVIEDDGCGINEQALQKIRLDLEDTEPGAITSHSSIGLKNVNARIRLLYGSNFGITVTSTPNEGTTIAILLPGSTGGNEHDQIALG